MRKVLLYSLLLVVGLIASQFLAAILKRPCRDPSAGTVLASPRRF